MLGILIHLKVFNIIQLFFPVLTNKRLIWSHIKKLIGY